MQALTRCPSLISLARAPGGVWSPPEQRGQAPGLGRKTQGAHSHAQLTYPSLVIQAMGITFALRTERSKCRAPWGCREDIHFKALVVCPNPAYSDYPNQAGKQ